MPKQGLRAFNLRGLTSLVVGFFFVVMSASGLVLYVAPQGRVAHWTNWTVFALDKEQWSAVHINSALLLVIVALLHLWFNWKPLWSYVRRKAVSGLKHRLEFPVALVVVGLVTAGSLCGMPPFDSVMGFNDQMKTYWARRAPRAPIPHSEELSLKAFAMHVNLLPEDAADALRKEGFVVEDVRITLAELAKQKDVAPSQVYEAVKKHFPTAGIMPGQGRGFGGGRGQGKGLGLGLGKGR